MHPQVPRRDGGARRAERNSGTTRPKAQRGSWREQQYNAPEDGRRDLEWPRFATPRTRTRCAEKPTTSDTQTTPPSVLQVHPILRARRRAARGGGAIPLHLGVVGPGRRLRSARLCCGERGAWSTRHPNDTGSNTRAHAHRTGSSAPPGTRANRAGRNNKRRARLKPHRRWPRSEGQ